MCELFAVSSEKPITVRYSLDRFAEQGGGLRSNKSGWGIAYYQDRDAFSVKEAEPAGNSPLARFVADRPIRSRLMMAHVRRATKGAPSYENTHPFRRAGWGRGHHFVHNGTLDGYRQAHAGRALAREVLGETDSELAFCALMARLRPIWDGADGVPEVGVRLQVFAELTRELTGYGEANLFYSDGDALFVHAHRRAWEREDGSLTEPHPPGLHIRSGDRPFRSNGCEIEDIDSPTIMIASVPLDEGGWDALPEGCAIAIRGGTELGRARTL